MKYLIASEGKTIEDDVCRNFLEARFYLIFDDADESTELITNNGELDSVQLIKKAAESGAGLLVCGNIDMRSFSAADQYQVMVGVSPVISARKAVELAVKKQLAIAKSPTSRRQAQHT